MRVLITGGAGFVGSHYAERLLARGDDVMCIDNYCTGRKDSLKAHPKLTVVEASITDQDAMKSKFQSFKPDVVVHAAASYKDPNDWITDVEVNVKGTAIVCELTKSVGAKRIIYFQTALCYGTKPLETPITLDHPILPDGSSYSISKTAGEQYVRLSGLDYVTFRLANAFGARNLNGPLPTFYKRLTQGQQCFVTDSRRDFIHISDLIDCAVKAVDGIGHGSYHISTGADASILELYNSVVKALRLNDAKAPDIRPRHPDDAPSILLDPSRTQKDFNWSAKTDLDKGVADAIAYYKEYGLDQTYTHLTLAHEDKSKVA